MASSQAIWNEYKQLSAIHYSADDFYDQSFVNRIGEAQRKIDNLNNERKAVDEKRLQAEDSYNTFFGNMRDYSSLNDEAENKFGVQTSMENYEKSKYAIAATEQSLSALPSTINRNSNVVLTQSQRELAYNTAADKWTQKMNTEKQAASDYEKTWQKARENANAYAEQLYGEQKRDLEALSLAWAGQSDQWLKTTELINSAESYKWQVQSDYRDWQWNQANIKNAYARAQAEDAFNRYIIQLRYESIARQEEYEKQKAASDLRMKQIKEEYAQRLVDNHFKYQQKKKEAEIYDSMGILGRLLYVNSHY